MTFKRHSNLADLGFSGPQCTNVFNQTEEIIARLDARNMWADCINMLYPGLSPILRPERFSQFAFTRFRRDLILSFDPEEGLWELRGATDEDRRPSPPNSGAPREESGAVAVEGTPPRKARKRASRRRRERVFGAHRLQQLSAQFRPILATTCAELAALARNLKRDAGAAWTSWGMPRVAAAFSDLFMPPADLSTAPALLRLEARMIEVCPGFTLVVHSFVADQPNWESWLFGEPPEEEQLAA